MNAVAPKFATSLPNLSLLHQGKTRDTYRTRVPDLRLVEATDRLSTHNVVHKSTVPRKGEVLTALTVFNAGILENAMIPHHIVAYGKEIYRHLPGLPSDYPADLHHRAIVVKTLEMVPVEFIYRGYMVGSLWKDWYAKGRENPYGIELDEEMQLMSSFSPPVFTPTEKSDTDPPLHTEETEKKYLAESAMSMRSFLVIRDYLRDRGIELVDSKFEVGHDSLGNTILADEFGTPDSSRFCDRREIRLGQEPPWLDKQVARDEAERVWAGGAKVPLTFSDAVVSQLTNTYLDVFEWITGTDLRSWQHSRLN